MKRLKGLVVCALLLLSLTGCGGDAKIETRELAPDPRWVKLVGDHWFSVHRLWDKELNVYCYIYSGSDKGGIDCIEMDKNDALPE